MTDEIKYEVGYVVRFSSIFIIPFVAGVTTGICAYRAGKKDGRKEAWDEVKTILSTNLETLKFNQTKTEPSVEE